MVSILETNTETQLQDATKRLNQIKDHEVRTYRHASQHHCRRNTSVDSGKIHLTGEYRLSQW